MYFSHARTPFRFRGARTGSGPPPAQASPATPPVGKRVRGPTASLRPLRKRAAANLKPNKQLTEFGELFRSGSPFLKQNKRDQETTKQSDPVPRTSGGYLKYETSANPRRPKCFVMKRMASEQKMRASACAPLWQPCREHKTTGSLCGSLCGSGLQGVGVVAHARRVRRRRCRLGSRRHIASRTGVGLV